MEKVYEKVKAPECLFGHLDDVYTPLDLDMILRSNSDLRINKSNYSEEQLTEAYRRGVLNKQRNEDGEIEYYVADVTVRYESLIQYEPGLWDSMKEEDVEAAAQVMMDPTTWLEARIKRVEEKKEKPEIVTPLEKVIKKMEMMNGNFVVKQCNCQSYLRGCERDKSNVCIHLVSDEDLNSVVEKKNGRIVSKEEAIEIVKQTDRDGLVHSMFERGLCNCCVCCCYNLVYLSDYQIKDNLLLTPYRAIVKEDSCIGCGACLPLCQFDALKLSDESMSVDVDKCWGCGVCRSVCPCDAIEIYEL